MATKRMEVTLESDSANDGYEGDAIIEILPGNRLRLTLQNPHREVVISAGQGIYSLLGKPKLQFDLGSLLGSNK